MLDADADGFAMLDVLLIPTTLSDTLVSISSDRTAALASHHFPVVANISCNVGKYQRPNLDKRLDWRRLRDHQCRRSFAEELSKCMHQPQDAQDTTWQGSCKQVLSEAARVIAPVEKQPNKPLISNRTLALLDKKREKRNTV